MKLEHGKSYISDAGEVVTVRQTNGTADFPFTGDNGKTYMADGTYTPFGESIHDLIGPALSAF